MRKSKRYLYISLLVLLSVSTVMAFHVPPWDTGHNSFQGDDGDDDTDPGDDGPCKSGSPVELASGNFVYSVSDLFIGGLGPSIELTRTYNSRDMRRGPFGNGWVFPYDQRLIETTNGVQVFAICSKPNGKREVFVKQSDGSYQSPPHVRATLVKNSDNTYTLRENTGSLSRFNSSGRLVAITDRNGNTLTLTYDSSGFPTSITDASGRTVQFTKGADGRIESATDPANRTFRYTYDSAGNLTRFTDPLGNSTTYQYDSKSNLLGILDPRGNKVLGATYDSGGRVATLLDGAETWTYSYLTNPLRTTKRDSANNTWTYFYNSTGNLTKLTDPLGNSEIYTYDANFNLISLTDKNGNKSTYTYDVSGNPLTITDALGKTRTLTYDTNFNNPLTIRERAGNLSQCTYDSRGNLTKITDPLGRAVQYTYDTKGLLVSVTDAVGNASTLSYDANGNLIKTIDALGNSSAASFNILGEMVTTTDAEGRLSQYSYDANGRLIRTIDPQGASTINEYDASGNIVAVTLANGARSTFEYDSLNRLVKTTNSLNQSTTYSYDKKNNLLTKTDPKGQQIQHTYDVIGRLIKKTKPDDTANYTYDAVGNLLSVQDGDSALTFVFDTLHRNTEARTGSSNQPTTTIRYTYDADGNRRSMTDPAGGVTNYAYDASAQLTSITDPVGKTFNFSYDNASRRTQLDRSGGPTSAYTYDKNNRITSVANQSAAGSLNFSYTLDRNGNRSSVSDSNGTHSYNYDALSQLVGVTHPPGGGPDESYAYDLVGNRTASHLSASYTHNAANRLTADAANDYSYDANGNLTGKTERATGKITAYLYNSENQLTQINFSDGTSASYRYDGFGRRIEKNVNGTIARYVYDGQDVLFEYNGSVQSARYTHGPRVDEVLSVRRDNTTYFFETDALGSVARISDDSGNVKASYSYDSFGRVINQSGTFQSPYRFHGREFDQESGLYYFRARYYDPLLGRFIHEDPLTFAGGLNYYRFALNNPHNVLDPFGLRPCIDSWLDGLQSLFDIAGLFPGFGEFFDLANAGIYALRGDALNAGLSLGAAVPFLGWTASATKIGNKVVKSTVKEGIYEFVSTSGKRYVGQSGDIDRRLLQHIRDGKVTAEEAARATRSEVSGGRTAREIAEQRRIDQLGGIQHLENKVNPIGPNRRHLLDR